MNLLFKIHWRYGFWAVLLEQHVSHNLSSAQTNQEGIKCKVEKIEEDSLDLIPSPPPSVKIQIIDRKVYLRQDIAWWCQQKLCFQKIVDNAQHGFLPLHLKQTFPPIIWIFTEGESDRIESRLPSKIFSTLHV